LRAMAIARSPSDSTRRQTGAKQPIFETRVERKVFRLRTGDASVEVAVDLVKLRAATAPALGNSHAHHSLSASIVTGQSLDLRRHSVTTTRAQSRLPRPAPAASRLSATSFSRAAAAVAAHDKLYSPNLKSLPSAAAPVSAALVFVPLIVLTLFPTPFFRMDGQTKVGAVVVLFLHMPAIPLIVADNASRGDSGHPNQRACTHQRGECHRA
jgi:hypothetical protein